MLKLVPEATGRAHRQAFGIDHLLHLGGRLEVTEEWVPVETPCVCQRARWSSHADFCGVLDRGGSNSRQLGVLAGTWGERLASNLCIAKRLPVRIEHRQRAAGVGRIERAFT